MRSDSGHWTLDVGPFLALLFASILLSSCGSKPAGHELVFVAAERGNAVTVIDLDSMKVAASIPVTPAPIAVRACPIRNEVYVATRAGRLEIIDAERLRVAGSVAVSGSPVRLELAEDGNTAFVLSRVQPVVHIVNLRARRVVRSIPLAHNSEPVAFKLAPNGNLLCVADAAGRDIQIVDLGHRGVVARVPLPAAPSSSRCCATAPRFMPPCRAPEPSPPSI